MIATDDAVQELLRETLDRLSRQEERVGELEAILTGLAAPRDFPRAACPSDPTPPAVPWPAPRSWRKPDHAVRVGELEARLAEAERRAERAEARSAAAEEQVRDATRLELVGRLVVGVAHDFNNLLAIISGNAELVREQIAADDPLRESAELVAATAFTAARIARQLIGFAKPGPPSPTPIDPNVALLEIERMLGRLAGDRITFALLLAPGVAPIRVDPGQFDQVLLNLMANARDAIAGDGAITVRTAAVHVDPDRPEWPTECPPGEYVAITVADTGCGMTEEVKSRAFARFFSTKGSKGTGLGLTTVAEIVRAAGGRIEVESSPEWGTSVRVYWPSADATMRSRNAP